jgi:hypothetical protein
MGNGEFKTAGWRKAPPTGDFLMPAMHLAEI